LTCIDTKNKSEFVRKWAFKNPVRRAAIIPEGVRSRREKARIENIHGSQGIAEKYEWKVMDLLIEMEIGQRKRELQDGTKKSYFSSDQEKRMNRWLKKV